MHHKYYVSSKVTFYIIDLNRKQRGIFCPLTFLSHQPHFSFSSGLVFHLPDEMVNWAWWEGKVRLMRRKSEGDKMCLFSYDSNFWEKKSQRPNLWYKMQLLRSHHIYGAYSLSVSHQNILCPPPPNWNLCLCHTWCLGIIRIVENLVISSLQDKATDGLFLVCYLAPVQWSI